MTPFLRHDRVRHRHHSHHDEDRRQPCDRFVPNRSGRRRIGRRRSVAALLSALVVALLVTVPGPAVGAADEPVSTSTPPTTVPDPGLGDLDGGATTPSPRGEAAPSRTQRVADSAIAVSLLVVLAGGVALAIWTARRGSGARTAEPSAEHADDPASGSQRGR